MSNHSLPKKKLTYPSWYIQSCLLVTTIGAARTPSFKVVNISFAFKGDRWLLGWFCLSDYGAIHVTNHSQYCQIQCTFNMFSVLKVCVCFFARFIFFVCFTVFTKILLWVHSAKNCWTRTEIWHFVWNNQSYTTVFVVVVKIFRNVVHTHAFL